MKYNNKTRTRKKKKKTFKRKKRKTRKNNHQRGGGPEHPLIDPRTPGLDRVKQEGIDDTHREWLTQLRIQEEEEEERKKNSLHEANRQAIARDNRGFLLHLALQAMSENEITWRDLFPRFLPSNPLTQLPAEKPVRKKTLDEAYYERLGNRHAIMVEDELFVNKPWHGPKFKGSRKKEPDEEEGEEDDDDSVWWWWWG